MLKTFLKKVAFFIACSEYIKAARDVNVKQGNAPNKEPLERRVFKFFCCGLQYPNMSLYRFINRIIPHFLIEYREVFTGSSLLR